MHGAGNDFVILDLFDQPGLAEGPLDRFAIAMCDRHRGAGGDGLLTLEPARLGSGCAVRMRMWNPDGTGDMCGNGLRCVAALAVARGRAADAPFQVETLAGPRPAWVEPGGQVTVGMGMPIFDAPRVPLSRLAAETIAGQAGAGRHGLSAGAFEYDLPVEGRLLSHVSSLSTGSTHTVIFGAVPVEESEFLRLSPQLEVHPWFPERSSIMWATRRGPNRFSLRIWERGVGETLACGTGACAVAVAAGLTGRSQGIVTLECRGGTLSAAWEPGTEIRLTGPTRRVFEGVFFSAL